MKFKLTPVLDCGGCDGGEGGCAASCGGGSSKGCKDNGGGCKAEPKEEPKPEPMIPLSCLEALKVMNLPDKGKGQGEAKCSHMLSRLLSSQAESTANTMKILGGLLKDDGCSLSPEEQQTAAKLMGNMMNGGCCSAFSNSDDVSNNNQPDRYEKYIGLGPDHCASRKGKKIHNCKGCDSDDESSNHHTAKSSDIISSNTNLHKIIVTSTRHVVPVKKSHTHSKIVHPVHPKFRNFIKEIKEDDNMNDGDLKKRANVATPETSSEVTETEDSAKRSSLHKENGN